MHTAIIALGSNIEPNKNIELAINKLNSLFNIVSKSKQYVSEPYGYKEQSDFINMVVKIKTKCSPYKLINILQTIEFELKRKRIIKNGPRTIDLDLLFFNNQKMSNKLITIPHKGINFRDFVLCPLYEIMPNYEFFKFNKRPKLKVNENV